MNNTTTTIRPWLCWIISVIILLLNYGIMILPSIMTQQLHADIGLSPKNVSIIATGYMIAYMILQIPAGLTLDRLGFRKVLSISCLILAFGCLNFAFSRSFAMVFISRMLMGLGGAGLFMAAVLLTKTSLPQKLFSFLIATIDGITGIGGIVILFVFVFLKNQFSWRGAYIYFAITLAVMGGVFYFLCPTDNKINNKQELKVLTGLKQALSNKDVWLLALYVGGCFSHVVVFTDMWRVPMILAKYSISDRLAITFNAYSILGFSIGAITIGAVANIIEKRKLILGAAIAQLIFHFISHGLAELAYETGEKVYAYLYLAGNFMMGFCVGGILLSFYFLKKIVPHNIYGTCLGIINMSFVGIGILLIPIVGEILERLDYEVYAIPMGIIDIVTILGILSLVCFLKRNPEI